MVKEKKVMKIMGVDVLNSVLVPCGDLELH